MNLACYRFLFLGVIVTSMAVNEAASSSLGKTGGQISLKNVHGVLKRQTKITRAPSEILDICHGGGEHDGFDRNGTVEEISNPEESAYRGPIHPPERGTQIETSTPQLFASSAPLGGANVSSQKHEESPSKKKNNVSSRLKNITERTGGALAVLIPGIFVAWKFGKPGMLSIVFLIQWGMYYETLKIIEDHYRTSSDVFERPLKRHWFQKWWWFATIVMATSFRALILTSDPSTVPQAFSANWLRQIPLSLLDLALYAMVALGLVKSVMGMALLEKGSPEVFRKHLAKMATSHFALLYLIGQSSFWIMTIQEFGLSWIVYPSLLVIVNDTMAYVFGCLVGKTKILPTLSPKKTVEGFIGAGLSTVAVSVPLLKFVLKRKGFQVEQGLVQHAVALSLFASIVAPFGGFLASAVKRAYNTKDFGSLIPGHGGVVDRFDCHLVTAPFVYLYLRHFWQKQIQ